jgi:hypothetical protein
LPDLPERNSVCQHCNTEDRDDVSESNREKHSADRHCLGHCSHSGGCSYIGRQNDPDMICPGGIGTFACGSLFFPIASDRPPHRDRRGASPAVPIITVAR